MVKTKILLLILIPALIHAGISNGSGSGTSSPNIAVITRPTPANFSWVNQGSATLVTTFGGLNITGAGASGTNVRAQVTSVVGATWVCDMYISVLLTPGNPRAGAVMRESSTDKMLTFGAGGGASHYADVL